MLCVCLALTRRPAESRHTAACWSPSALRGQEGAGVSIRTGSERSPSLCLHNPLTLMPKAQKHHHRRAPGAPSARELQLPGSIPLPGTSPNLCCIGPSAARGEHFPLPQQNTQDKPRRQTQHGQQPPASLQLPGVPHAYRDRAVDSWNGTDSPAQLSEPPRVCLPPRRRGSAARRLASQGGPRHRPLSHPVEVWQDALQRKLSPTTSALEKGSHGL